jgi:hypothetical protein
MGPINLVSFFWVICYIKLDYFWAQSARYDSWLFY